MRAEEVRHLGNSRVHKLYRTARLGHGKVVHVVEIEGGADFGWPLCGHTTSYGWRHQTRYVPDAPTCARCIQYLAKRGITLEEEA